MSDLIRRVRITVNENGRFTSNTIDVTGVDDSTDIPATASAFAIAMSNLLVTTQVIISARAYGMAYDVASDEWVMGMPVFELPLSIAGTRTLSGQLMPAGFAVLFAQKDSTPLRPGRIRVKTTFSEADLLPYGNYWSYEVGSPAQSKAQDFVTQAAAINTDTTGSLGKIVNLHKYLSEPKHITEHAFRYINKYKL